MIGCRHPLHLQRQSGKEVNVTLGYDVVRVEEGRGIVDVNDVTVTSPADQWRPRGPSADFDPGLNTLILKTIRRCKWVG